MKRHSARARNKKRTAMVAGSAIAAISLFGISESANAAETPAIPIGSLDSTVTGVGTIKVNGWAIEPDTTAPISVQIFVDGVYNQTVSATTERDDVDEDLNADGCS